LRKIPHLLKSSEEETSDKGSLPISLTEQAINLPLRKRSFGVVHLAARHQQPEESSKISVGKIAIAIVANLVVLGAAQAATGTKHYGKC